jgi:acetyl esterase/lipase
MKSLPFLFGAALLASAFGEDVKMNVARDLSYGEDPLQKVDVYAAPGAKDLPVVVWIHGGGWEKGDKAEMARKPQAFAEKGFVFVSVNYRMLPQVVMGDIVRDVAKSVGWVNAHIAEHGGDPKRLFVMGHSAGAQLAALLCTDERYLKAEGVAFTSLKGCVPVDGDTYDIPLIIAMATAQRLAAGQPEPKYGHREKFGTPEQWLDYSAVNHVARDKGIPPFLLLHVADHENTSAEARRLGSVLTEAGIPTQVFGGSNTNHGKMNADLGLPDDACTKEVFAFVAGALKR